MKTKQFSLAIILLNLLLRLWIIISGVVPFNSDEAIVALMAKHILDGERPFFFYGQAYMGSIDAWFVSAGFFVFGEEIWVIRVVQAALYIATLITVIKIGEVGFGSRKLGNLSALLLSIPSVTMVLYSTVSLGGYGEALLIGNLMILVSIRTIKSIKRGKIEYWSALILGFLTGLGLWTFGLTLVYSVPIYLVVFGLSILKKQKDKAYEWKTIVIWIIVSSMGVMIGSLPWWIFAISNGFSGLLAELLGSAIAYTSPDPYWLLVGKRITSFLLFGLTAILGFRPSWEFNWLALPLLPFAFAIWMGTFHFGVRKFKLLSNDNKELSVIIFMGIPAVLISGFVFTSFGNDPSGRYFLPLLIPLSLLFGFFIIDLQKRSKPFALGVLGLLLMFNLIGIIQSATRFPPGITTQFDAVTQVDHNYMAQLINFLEENGEKRGYTNYWVSYPLAFESNEELIFTPRLPYHTDLRYTSRDDRYDPYSTSLIESDRVAFITTKNANLDQMISQEFLDREITWDEEIIGDYKIFYNLSRVIHPEEIGF